jgi:hypothetical protein
LRVPSRGATIEEQGNIPRFAARGELIVAADYDEEKRTVPGSRDFMANGIFREINVDTVQGMQVGENNVQIINNYASPKVTLAACRELVKEVFGLRTCVQDLAQCYA